MELADVHLPGAAASDEPTTGAPRTDGSDETLGGELEAGPCGALGLGVVVVVVVVPAEVVVVGPGPVVVVPVDGEVIVAAGAVVVAGGAGTGPADTPIAVVSGPFPAHGLALGIA